MKPLSPEISVVMAIRDAEATLAEALQSIAEQSLPAEEIILVLNGCRDASESIAKDWAARDKRVRLFESSTEGGVAEAAKLGCEVATCPLLARMDADDVADNSRFEEQWAALSEHEADLVTCRVESVNSLGEGLERFVSWANGLKTPEDFRRERFVESPVIQPGVLMRREFYLAAGEYRVEEGPEDYDLWLRMLENGARFFQAEKARLQWRDSRERLTRCHEDYSEHRMAATKARYLARLARVKEQGVMISGSGPIGRRLAKLLLAEGVDVHGFFDVAPSKIGGTVLSLPVWGPHDFGFIQREAMLLGCVGRGGRDRVRALAVSAGYREGEDFFACC